MTASRAAALVALTLAMPVAEPAPAATGDLTPKGCVGMSGLQPEACAKSMPGLTQPGDVTVSPDGESVYVASAGSDAIAMFRRMKGSGELIKRGCIEDDDVLDEQCPDQAKGLDQANAVAVAPGGDSVYVTAYGDDSVVHFERGRSTARLEPAGCVDDPDTGPDNCAREAEGMVGASDVVVSPNGRAVYVAAYTAVVRFKRDPQTGALKARGCIGDDDVAGTGCGRDAPGLAASGELAISADGRSLYTTSGTFGDTSVARFKLDPQTGAMKAKGCITYTMAENCAKESSLLSGPNGIALSPDGRSAYVTTGGTDAVVRLGRDPQNGALEVKTCVDDDDSPAPCGVGYGLAEPFGVAVSDDGKSVYVAGSAEDAVVQLKRLANGGLLFESCVSDDDTGTVECIDLGPGLNRAVAVAVSPDSRSVYSVGADDNAISRYRRET